MFLTNVNALSYYLRIVFAVLSTNNYHYYYCYYYMHIHKIIIINIIITIVVCSITLCWFDLFCQIDTCHLNILTSKTYGALKCGFVVSNAQTHPLGGVVVAVICDLTHDM